MEIPTAAKPALIGAAAGAVTLAIVGFSWGGWVSGSTAERMASDQARAEVVLAMTPVCLEKSAADPNAGVTLARLKEAGTYQRPDILMEAGWATMPGADEPNRVIALSCIRTLSAGF